MGGVILKSLLNFILAILTFILFKGYLNSQYYLVFFLFVFLIIVILPYFKYLNEFKNEKKTIIEETLCSTCSHFDKSAVLCTKFDEHPTESYLPCEGECWEPDLYLNNSKEQYEQW